MSGVTDAPFRRLTAALGAGLVVSEMTASDDLVNGRPMSRLRCEATGIGPHVVQLAGCEVRWMAEGARIVTGEGAAIIDINMGCPARHVTNGESGSALMRDLDHAVSLIDATVAATPVPVIFALLLIAGFFQSLQFTATQAMTYADVEQPQMSSATSIASMSQQLSRGFGIAFVAALLNLSLAWRGGEHLGLPDFTVAFAGAALLGLLNFPFGWALRHDAAAEVSGHRPPGVV